MSIPFYKFSRFKINLRFRREEIIAKTPLKIFGRYYFVVCEKEVRSAKVFPISI